MEWRNWPSESIDVDLEGIPITLHENRFAGDRVQFVLAE
jgi:hypothetical protein